MEKYYTPEIEEFHEGFEFEYKPRVRKGVIRFMEGNHEYFKEWRKGIFTIDREQIKSFEDLEDCYHTPASVYEINSYLRDSAVRVKHLDREGIESLGFEAEEPSGSGSPGDYYLIKNAKFKKPTRTEVNELHLIHQPIINWILIWQTMKFNTGNHHNVRFSGTIKNKSELKRILKQLGCHS